MLVLEIVLLLAAALGGGYVGARYVPLRPAAPGGRVMEELDDLRLERDRLRLELDDARREPATSDAVDARVEHLKSAVHAAKRRIAELEDELREAQRMIAVISNDPAAAGTGGQPPERLEQPDGVADDLKRITGIGPSIERQLNEMGIFHFWQIAALDPAQVAWLESHLPIRGRITRQDWMGQAKGLESSDLQTVT